MSDITFRVYDGASPTTFIGDLDNATQKRFADTLNDTGSGAFSLGAEDEVLTTTPTILAYDNLVRCAIHGTDRFTWVIENRDVPPAPPGEKRDKIWNVSGRGVLKLLEDSIVYPENPNGSHARQRRFDWTAIAYDDSSWIAATQIQQQGSGGDEVRWHNAPSGWPPYHTGVYWIWSRAKDAPYPSGKMPVGTSYFRREYTAASDIYVLIAATCDNEFQLFLDGEPILDGNDWSQTYETKIAIPAGDHEFAVVGTNDTFSGASPAAPGGPAGFLFLMLQLDDANAFLGTPILVSDSSWLALDYPATVPGMTVGQIMHILIDEAQTRGGLPGITRSFTDTLDSHGVAWTEEPNIVLDVGTNYLDVMRTFVEQFVDTEMSPTLVFSIYEKYTLGQDLRSTVQLEVATDFEEESTTGESHSTNSVLARDTTGLLTERDNGTSLASHKRKEMYLELALAPDESRAQAMSDQVFTELAFPVVQVTAKVTEASGPYTVYGKGDQVQATGPLGVLVDTNIVTLGADEDIAGRAVYHIEGMQDDASS